MKKTADLAAWIEQVIKDFIERSPHNTLQNKTTEDYVKTHYDFDGYGCGLCQTKVPCESKIPSPQDVE